MPKGSPSGRYGKAQANIRGSVLHELTVCQYQAAAGGSNCGSAHLKLIDCIDSVGWQAQTHAEPP